MLTGHMSADLSKHQGSCCFQATSRISLPPFPFSNKYWHIPIKTLHGFCTGSASHGNLLEDSHLDCPHILQPGLPGCPTGLKHAKPHLSKESPWAEAHPLGHLAMKSKRLCWVRWSWHSPDACKYLTRSCFLKAMTISDGVLQNIAFLCSPNSDLHYK